MSFIGDERIYPPALSVKIEPPTENWPKGSEIGALGSVAGVITDRTLLPQGLGRMGSVHGVEHLAQTFPIVQRLRGRFYGQLPPRGTGLLTGTARIAGQGLLDRVSKARERLSTRLRGQTTIQPTPWGPRRWPITSAIANMPSVASVMSGPGRSMYPMLSRGDMSVGDGRDIAIHQEFDNPYPEIDLKTELSVMVE